MLTARSELEDRIEGLTLGRLLPDEPSTSGSCWLHQCPAPSAVPQVDQLMLGNTVLDLGACTLSCGIKYVRLSAKEFDVMRFLLQAQSSIISKEVILAWGMGV